MEDSLGDLTDLQDEILPLQDVLDARVDSEDPDHWSGDLGQDLRDAAADLPDYADSEVSPDGPDAEIDSLSCDPVDCDDGLPCTLDQCRNQECFHDLVQGTCLVDQICFMEGESPSDDPCLVCSSTLLSSELSRVEDGTPCGDGLRCFLGECCDPSVACQNRACGDDGCGGLCGLCEPGHICDAGVCTCVPDCGGRQCGDDGCQGQCGLCEPGYVCDAGVCACVPDCEGRQCGDDGCQGQCGLCEPGLECSEGTCTCVPDCGDLSCGNDGCNGSCGQCDLGLSCVQGHCLCIPDCLDGQMCGDDGCGGSCGECGAGLVCLQGDCVCLGSCEGLDCGDDGCGGSCGQCDGDWFCVDGECLDCLPDCQQQECGGDGCGGSCGECEGELRCLEGECVECPPDCSDRECGDDGCSGSCGQCEQGAVCEDGLCRCVPRCEGLQCGDDGCGGSCGECTLPLLCSEGECLCVPLCLERDCGDDGCGGSCGLCGAGTDCVHGQCICVPDCEARGCGDDGCGGSCGGCPGGWDCEAGACVCNPECTGLECGEDGCGGFCGTCPQGWGCEAGTCVCIPACLGLECGDDACGGSCGTCPEGWGCKAGACVCIPDCTGLECGDDHCGGSCGTCPEGWGCEAGACVCIPACLGLECGDDQCGGSCGTCSEGWGCEAGACVCIPDCTGLECGDDGCGGSCGDCLRGLDCIDGVCGCQGDCTGRTCGDDGCGGSCGLCSCGLECDIRGECIPRFDWIYRGEVTGLAAGRLHACGLLETGGVICWGDHSLGQLGAGPCEDCGDLLAGTLGQIPLGGAAVQLAAGENHTCALLDTGEVRCWGDNSFGQLGYPDLSPVGDDETPAEMPALPLEDVRELSLGMNHTCVLTTSLAIRCFGDNSRGQLGYGYTDDLGGNPWEAGELLLDPPPTSISSGGRHTCALLADGGVRCWGDNSHGQLGIGNVELLTSPPEQDIDLGQPAVKVVTGYYHTCALLQDGSVQCWGYNQEGQLGRGDTLESGPMPPAPIALGGTATALEAGFWHTCAEVLGVGMLCWGRGDSYGLGYTSRLNVGDDELPVTKGPVSLHLEIKNLTCGDGFTCVVQDFGEVLCWGAGTGNQLGYGTHEDLSLYAVNRRHDFVRVGCCRSDCVSNDCGPDGCGGSCEDCAQGFSCQQGQCLCEPRCEDRECGGDGCLGSCGTCPQDKVCVDGHCTCGCQDRECGEDGCGSSCGVCEPGLTCIQGACVCVPDCTGRDCGSDGCGGSCGACGCGQACDEDGACRTMEGWNRTRVVDLTAGSRHACALLEDGRVRCWGLGEDGRLGYGNTDTIGDDESPAMVGDVPLGGPASAIDAGVKHTCALLEGGGVRCWGDNESGQLGYGHTDDIGDDETPEEVGDVPLPQPAVAISAGAAHTCAVLEGGAIRCWGKYSYGQLGYGHGYKENIGDDETPAEVNYFPINALAQDISTGGHHTCALLSGGNLRCWGYNYHGQLGYGHTDTLGLYNTPADYGDVPLGDAAVEVALGSAFSCALLEGGRVRCWGRDIPLGYGLIEEKIGAELTPEEAGDISLGGIATGIDAGASHVCAILEGGRVLCWGDSFYQALGRKGYCGIGTWIVPSQVEPLDLPHPVVSVAAGDDFTCVAYDRGDVHCWGANRNGSLGYGRTDYYVDIPAAGISSLPYLKIDCCAMTCDGQTCDPAGCAGACGTCPQGEACIEGTCECLPDCGDRECGDDGCGGSCGECPADTPFCREGLCRNDCLPDCAGKECGDDGCGGSCGECEWGSGCMYGVCGATVSGCDSRLDVNWDTSYSMFEWEVLYYAAHLTVPQDMVVSMEILNNSGYVDSVYMDACLYCGMGCCDYTVESWEDDSSPYDNVSFIARAGHDYYVRLREGPLAWEHEYEGRVEFQRISHPLACLPDCNGRVCGDDGCSGSCGVCKEGEVCAYGTCCPSSCPVGAGCSDSGCGRLCPSQTPDLWVDRNRGLETFEQCGSQTNPYSSIQDAVDASGEGTVIHILPGVYREDVEITTPGITLQGEGLVRLIKPDLGEAWEGHARNMVAGVTVKAIGVTLRNLEIEGYFRGVYIQSETTQALLQDLMLLDNKTGVYAVYSEDLSMQGLTISYGNQGISLYKVDGCSISDSTIVGLRGKSWPETSYYPNPSSGGNCTGMLLALSRDVELEHSLIQDLKGGRGQPGTWQYGFGGGGDATGIRTWQGNQEIRLSNVTLADIYGGEHGSCLSNTCHYTSDDSVGVSFGIDNPNPEPFTGSNLVLAGMDDCLTGSSVNMSYSCYWGCAVEAGALDLTNQETNPQFQEDFTLGPESLCVDQGDPCTDCNNEPQPNGCRVNPGWAGNTTNATSRPGAQHCPDLCPQECLP